MSYRLSIFCFLLLGSLLLNAQDVRINEFLASNISTASDELGQYDDWVEIYNASNAQIDLAGYYITDDLNDLQKWQIPDTDPTLTTIAAGGYLLLWADDESHQGILHLPFRLMKDGEDLALISADGNTIVDSLSFSEQHADISFGRDVSGSGWGYFDQPTPGAANAEVSYLGVAETPTVSLAGGVYSGSQLVELSLPDPSAEIRFTLNGDDPGDSASVYAGAIEITSSAVLRARAFKSGYIASSIASHPYFIDEDFTLPVLTIMTDPDNLFDDSLGIYTNYNSQGVDWERPMSSLFLKDDLPAFSIDAGIRIQGRTSRVRAKKSFRLFFKSGYGSERLAYPVFDISPVESFKNLVLRSGYDDDIQMPTGSLLRDPLTNENWRNLGELATHSTFASLYLNDEYWGIYNIRESVNEHFISDQLGYTDFDLIRYLKQAYSVKYGSMDEFNALYTFIRQNDFSQAEAYQEALERIDMENFLNLQALVVCSEYRSWGWGVFAYRERVADAKWRWTLWDMDRTYTNVNWNPFTFIDDTVGLEQPNLIAKRLLDNPQFKNDYINRVADFLNTRFSPENIIARIDSLAAIIEPEIANEGLRWNRSVSHWENGVQSLRNFANARPGIVRTQLLSYFALPSWVELTLDADPSQGTILVNTVTPDSFPWSGSYVETIPIELTAMPNPGYRFVGWSDNELDSEAIISLALEGDKSLTANFAPEDTVDFVEIIAPNRVRNGEHLPIVFRVRAPDGSVNPHFTFNAGLSSPVTLGDTLVKIKKGTGTLATKITGSGQFTLTLDHAELESRGPSIEVVDSTTVVTYSGTLPAGVTVWDATADRLVTADLVIEEGSELQIEAGTRVLLASEVNITVSGALTVAGTASAPVLFTADDWEAPWGGIEFYSSESNIAHCFFVKGGADPAKGWAHTNTQPLLFARDYSTLNLDNVFVLYSPGKALGGLYSTVNVKESVTAFVFHGGEFHYTMLDYDNSYVMNIPNDDGVFADDDNDGFHIDWVHPDAIGPSSIRNSFFLTGKDDAIDHNRSRLEIVNCWIEDWIHEGVATSGADTVWITNTVALRCEQGFEAGWGAPQMFLDHCVAAENTVGLRFGDSYTTPATGQITATNLIMYDNEDNIRNFVKNINGPQPGAIDITWSMTNDVDFDSFPNCITGVPEFDENYHLLTASPGQWMGSAGKPMGIVTDDMLAYGPLLINELMYKPGADQDFGDWLELFNPHETAVEIGNWTLKDDDDGHSYNLPQGTTIPPGGYWLIAGDSSAFADAYPDIANMSGGLDFGFGLGDQVRIYAATGATVDSVAYDIAAPWPTAPNGGGPSLELVNRRDNSRPENWSASGVAGGTPGYQNSLVGISRADDVAVPTAFELLQNYPNPFNPTTAIPYNLRKAAEVKLVVFDILGRRVRTLVKERQAAGNKMIIWDGLSENEERVGSGIYFYRLSVDSYSQVKKMVLLR